MAADLPALYTALKNADAAGDTAGAQKLAAYIKSLPASMPAEDPNMAATGGGTLRPFGIDTHIPLPDSLFNGLAGAGKSFADMGRGVAQLFGANNQADIDAAKQRDAALMSTKAGMGGNIAGNVAMALPAAAIPGANTYVGAGLIGAGLGALQPTATGESRPLNTVVGAGAGLAGQGASKLLSRAITPITSSLSPEAQALANAAKTEGIPLTAGQQTGSKPLQVAESVLENLPLTSSTQIAGKQAQQSAFTAAALRRAGITGTTADAATLGAQKSALGQTFEGIAGRNGINFSTNDLTGKLANIVDDASQHLPPDSVSKVSGTVDKILQQVGPNDLMTGNNYQGWRTPLQAMAKKGDETSRYFGQIKQALDSEFSSQVSGADASAWQGASRQYANLKTLLQAAGGPGNSAAEGQIAPTQLRAALAQSVGKEGIALGRGDMNQLSKIGQLFVRDQIPNSGTAQRELIQSLVTGGGGAGVGAIAGYASGHDPWEGAMYGAGAGGAALVAPKLVQSLMNSDAGQAYLKNTLMSPAAREMLATALRSGAIGATESARSQ